MAARLVLADNGLPRPDHIVIVVEENKAFTQIIGSPSAPYINALAAGGALMTQSYGITHPSQPNYIAFFAGSTLGVVDNSMYPHSNFTAPNLGSKIRAAGYTFAGYSQTMPSVGFDGTTAGNAITGTYQRKHNPWANWQDATFPLPANKLPLSVNLPYEGYFPSDYSTLPTISIVVPNQLYDMHDGTIEQGDTWLAQNLGGYAQWCQKHNSLLLVTFDEDDSAHANRVCTIFYGPMVVTGASPQIVNHYNILRTLEDMYSLPHSANTVSATPVTGIWAGPPCYPNCDGSSGSPALTSNDFQCFLNRFAAGESYANCDFSTGSPTLTSNDFQCFLNSFAAGCT